MSVHRLMLRLGMKCSVQICETVNYGKCQIGSNTRNVEQTTDGIRDVAKALITCTRPCFCKQLWGEACMRICLQAGGGQGLQGGVLGGVQGRWSSSAAPVMMTTATVTPMSTAQLLQPKSKVSAQNSFKGSPLKAGT